ncbi:hypothetical protein FOXG_17828 [Fusarium oxysporum f. sp. lycopersici 4287]|uniref:Uncharacterized protein n=2 Tax=Fusarium oxysporum TaxID=5507 RepID=A0A0J9U4J6_FUSO4|nr:hypothetical protein FOXG_17828 [Fusarium oxysporum f. sp. lycopersici 4287]EXK47471.1 hypothetical protein FOMG_00857 [Fusarium oxysporum f. sp. melonis 26406]KNA93869.1 hypothetical protein FOXG_17828 [Fusarium oxysporum f. sp. lycopersici 4287]
MQQVDGDPLFLLRCASRNASLQPATERFTVVQVRKYRGPAGIHLLVDQKNSPFSRQARQPRCKTLAATSQMLKSHDCHAFNVDPGFFDLSHFSFENSLSPFLKHMPLWWNGLDVLHHSCLKRIRPLV